MYVIAPRTINDFMSQIAEPDSSAGEVEWSPYVSAIGDERIVVATHRRYKAAISSSDDPVTGSMKNPKTWVDISPTNKWAIFDNKNSTQSMKYGGWYLQYTPGTVTPNVAGFNITGAKKVVVTVTSDSLPQPWVKEIPMVDNSAVIDYWTWSFLPLAFRAEFIVTDMPFYSDAIIKLDFQGEDYVGVGSVIFGTSTYLGAINYGTSFKLLAGGIEDDSAALKLIDYKFTITKNDGGSVFRLFKSLLKKPAVYFASENVDDGSMVLGYYVDSNISIDTPIFEPVSLSVKEVA